MATFTTRVNLTFDAYQKLWNIFVTNDLRGILGVVGEDWKLSLRGMSVVEPQKRSAPHLHAVFALGEDVGTGVEWRWKKWKGKKVYFITKRSKPASLEALQVKLRAAWNRCCQNQAGIFHEWMGTANLLPIRTDAASAARYLSQYLKGGSQKGAKGLRLEEWKNRRMYRQYGGRWAADVETGRRFFVSCHPCNGNFTTYARMEVFGGEAVKGGAREKEYAVYDVGAVRRARIAHFAASRGCQTLGEFCGKYGANALYRFSKEINDTLMPATYVFPSMRTAMWETANRSRLDPDENQEAAEARIRFIHRKLFADSMQNGVWSGDPKAHVDGVFSLAEISLGRKMGKEYQRAAISEYRKGQTVAA